MIPATLDPAAPAASALAGPERRSGAPRRGPGRFGGRRALDRARRSLALAERIGAELALPLPEDGAGVGIGTLGRILDRRAALAARMARLCGI